MYRAPRRRLPGLRHVLRRPDLHSGPGGACCFEGGFCVETFDAVDCLLSGGDFQGYFTFCFNGTCPGVGACCLSDGICISTDPTTCLNISGDFQGFGTTCGDVTCPLAPLGGACCFSDGTCLDTFLADECLLSGGVFTGYGTICDDVTCPPDPGGACCLPDGSCIDSPDAFLCLLAFGGDFQGFGTACVAGLCPEEDPGDCPGIGDCCSENTTPGCDDVDCCELVCAFDPFCCDAFWDAACAAEAVDFCVPCFECGSAGAGDCCADNGTPYCDDADCCEKICAVDPFCCDVAWDFNCAFEAAIGCEVACGAPTGACCLDDGSCIIETVFTCELILLGIYQGDGITCPNVFFCSCPGDGSCYQANGTPGCNDPACCETVCTVDIFCCEVAWDLACKEQANVLCGACGDPGAGDCYTANNTPGCDDLDCCRIVCEIVPFCCEVAWDELCKELANDLCGNCGSGGDCCTANAAPGCDDFECCRDVCEVDPFCCAVAWDQACADQAADICCPLCETSFGACCFDDPIDCLFLPQCECEDLGGVFQGSGVLCEEVFFCACPGDGDCCTANFTPGCDDEDCCMLVCDQDPFCCDVSWDQLCADQAIDFCVPCFQCGSAGAGDCCTPNPNPYCDDADCCEKICTDDPFCCEVEWDGLCADEALIGCDVACGAPIGACCLDDGSCIVETVFTCEQILLGVYQGDGSSCTPRLSLEVSGECLNTDKITVELWARDLHECVPATGFQAFLFYDTGILDFAIDNSFYIDDVFPTHITMIENAEGPDGFLQLDGASAFPDPVPATDDVLLAVLSFDVLVECVFTTVNFDLGAPFASELSITGFPIVTDLVDTIPFFADFTPPVIDCPDDVTVECDADSSPASTGTATATDNCDPDPAIGFSDVENLDGCGGTGTIERTWTATDFCGRQSSCVQTITVVDTTDPEIQNCPDDITVDADAGGCDAQVFWTEPTATDNCALDTFEPDFSPGDIFPEGDTLVTYTATDECGNFTECVFTVTVEPFTEADLEVILVGSVQAERCIRFIALDCENGLESDPIDVFVEFDVDGFGVAKITLPCGSWTHICAKDEKHTQWGTAALLSDEPRFASDGAIVLEAGDNDNDGDVDINDVTLLLFQFGGPEPGNNEVCEWDGIRGADYSNNGNVSAEDYSLLSGNWLTATTCGCPTTSAATLPTSVLVAELDPLIALHADLDRNGVVDYRDVRIFERRMGLPALLSKQMRRSGN